MTLLVAFGDPAYRMTKWIQKYMSGCGNGISGVAHAPGLVLTELRRSPNPSG